jgi:hypothetical protein
MPNKRPAVLFYSGDWLKDPAVRKCSLAARGAWIDLLSYMWADGGHSLTGSLADFARLCSCSEAEMADVLDEFERYGTVTVTKCHATGDVTRNADITLTCRRLERESKSNENNRLRQRRYRATAARNGDVAQPRNAKVTPPSSCTSTITVPPSISPPSLVDVGSAELLHFVQSDFFDLLKSRFPHTRHDKQKTKILDTLDKLIRIDNFGADEIVQVLRWWLTSETDRAAWWRENGCKSAATLRKRRDGNPHKFAQMLEQMQAGRKDPVGSGIARPSEATGGPLEWN